MLQNLKKKVFHGFTHLLKCLTSATAKTIRTTKLKNRNIVVEDVMITKAGVLFYSLMINHSRAKFIFSTDKGNVFIYSWNFLEKKDCVLSCYHIAFSMDWTGFNPLATPDTILCD